MLKKTIHRGKKASTKGIFLVKKVRSPIERVIHRQPVPMRYTRWWVTIIFGTINLINPFIPGWFLIIAWVSIIHKTRKGVLQEKRNILLIKTKGLPSTFRHILEEKRKQLAETFSSESYKKVAHYTNKKITIKTQ